MQIKRTVTISADRTKVWSYLTEPPLMEKWMGEPEMKIQVKTDWVVGHSIFIEGFHHISFRNNGTVLQFDPASTLSYNNLSSMSRLPDRIENYTVLTFSLSDSGESTLLDVTIENFPAETIYKHINFYWQGTLEIFRRLIELN